MQSMHKNVYLPLKIVAGTFILNLKMNRQKFDTHANTGSSI